MAWSVTLKVPEGSREFTSQVSLDQKNTFYLEVKFKVVQQILEFQLSIAKSIADVREISEQKEIEVKQYELTLESPHVKFASINFTKGSYIGNHSLTSRKVVFYKREHL